MNLNDNIEFLSLRLQTNPDSYLFARLADYLLSNGEVDKAIEFCENGLKKHPYYVSAHFVMGKCYLQKKMYDQAEKEFKRVLFFDPKFLAAHKYYAEIMQHIGWDNAVENSYRSILQIDPFDNETRQKLEALIAEKKDAIQDEDTLPFPETDDSDDFLTTEAPEPQEPEEGDKIPAAEIELGEATQSSEETLSGVEESTLSEQIFEAVIEEEPPSAEDEEKFSYILDDIFREESAIDDGLDSFETAPKDIDSPAVEEIFSEPEPKTETNVPENASELPEDFFSDSEIEIPEENTVSEDEFVAFETETETPPEEKRPKIHPTPRPPAETEELEELKELARDVQTNGKTDESKNRAQEEQLAEMPEAEENLSAAPKRKKEKIVTPTLGEIYAAQGQYAKAIGVFEILRKKEPTNSIYIEKIKYLKKKLEEASAEA